RIARAIACDGVLFCVDPWPDVDGRPDPCWLICKRHLQRARVWNRVKILRGLSSEVVTAIPLNIDFAFIDGDHSWSCIENDWQIVSTRLVAGGIVCLHDVVVPAAEPWFQPESTKFYREVIENDRRFNILEVVRTLSVLQKR